MGDRPVGPGRVVTAEVVQAAGATTADLAVRDEAGGLAIGVRTQNGEPVVQRCGAVGRHRRRTGRVVRLDVALRPESVLVAQPGTSAGEHVHTVGLGPGRCDRHSEACGDDYGGRQRDQPARWVSLISPSVSKASACAPWNGAADRTRAGRRGDRSSRWDEHARRWRLVIALRPTTPQNSPKDGGPNLGSQPASSSRPSPESLRHRYCTMAETR